MDRQQLEKQVVHRLAGWVGALATAVLLFVLVLGVLADPGEVYVSGTTGSDSGSCGTAVAPCQTIQYTLDNRANPGDVLLISAGTYTENVGVQISVTLKGGYDPASWTRDVALYETILDGSAVQPLVGDWDGRHVKKPSVLWDGSQYRMWYDGVNLLYDVEVGEATSADGQTWQRNPNNPVLPNQNAPWNDPASERSPFVLGATGAFTMYFEAATDGVRSLYRATGADGTAWTVDPATPILTPTANSYDENFVGHGSVLVENGVHRLWYHAGGNQGYVIAYAESDDGVADWDKIGTAVVPQPGDWYEWAVWGPSIVVDGSGDHWLFFSGVGPAYPPSIGAFTSDDGGQTWTAVGSQPLITGVNQLADPHVIYEGGLFKMWFSNNDDGAIYYTQSADGQTWADPQAVFYPGNLGTFGLPVVDIFNHDAEVVLDGLTITNGYGEEAGGVRAGDATLAIRNCLIHHNTADGSPDSWGGGGIIAHGNLTVSDSLVIHNSARQGAGGIRVGEGALHLSNSLVAANLGDAGLHLNGTAVITNVTIANNAPGTDRPGINFNPQTGLDLYVTNSILFGNAGGSIHIPDANDAHISYSAVEGGWPGTGNISDNPQFVDAAHGDYRLQFGSPAIDTGANNGASLYDLLGILRPQDGDLDGTAVSDMGAYEWLPYQVYLPVIVK